MSHPSINDNKRSFKLQKNVAYTPSRIIKSEQKQIKMRMPIQCKNRIGPIVIKIKEKVKNTSTRGTA